MQFDESILIKYTKETPHISLVILTSPATSRRFEFLKAGTTYIVVLRNMTPCSLVSDNNIPEDILPHPSFLHLSLGQSSVLAVGLSCARQYGSIRKQFVALDYVLFVTLANLSKHRNKCEYINL